MLCQIEGYGKTKNLYKGFNSWQGVDFSLNSLILTK